MKERILFALKKVNEDADFGNSADFIEDGLLDSFEMVGLVEELEDEFSIEIKGSDIVPENFINLDTIMKLVQSYLEG